MGFLRVRFCAALGLLAMVSGCVTVPLQESFEDMEEAALRRDLIASEDLPRQGPGDIQPTQGVRDMLAQGVTIDEAVRIALANNHRIQAQYEALGVAAAERLASRLLKNPEAEASLKVSEENSDEEVLEAAAEIDALHILLLPARRRLGDARYAAAQLDVLRAVQDLAFEVRTAFYRLLAAEERLKMVEAVAEAAEAGSEMAGRIREAGNIKKLDLLNRQAMHQDALLAIAAAELERIEAQEHLNTLMGLWGSDTQWDTRGELAQPPQDEVRAESYLETALENSFAIDITRQRIEAASVRLGIARVESFIPQLHIGVEAEREPENVWLVGPMLAVEIPLFDFGQAERPAVAAEIRRLQHTYAAQAVETRAAVRTAMKRLESARERVAIYGDDLLPLREEITRQTQLQYNAMQIGVFQLLQGKQREIMARGRYIDELLNYWIVHTELQHIRGGLLVTGGSIQGGAAMSLSIGAEGGGH